MTRNGGPNGISGPGRGIIFKLLPDGTSYSIIKPFSCFNFDPCVPSSKSGLIQLADGYLYGTTAGGGANLGGTVFKILPNGTNFTVIKSFNGTTDGCAPNGLVQGLDSFLYGTNQACGTGNAGTVFKLLPSGASFSVIKSFICSSATNGCQPNGEIVQSSIDGFLYGTTLSGGANCAFGSPGLVGCDGTVFKLSTDGLTFNILKSLDCAIGGPGCQPNGELIPLSDGYLYGNAAGGGASGAGTVFRLLPDGTLFSVLHDFGTPIPGGSGGLNDGIAPERGLLHLGDDFLYGVAIDGGLSFGGTDQGTVFKLARNGTGFTVLHTFGPSPLTLGAHPNTGLILANDQNIYGTTREGGQALSGTIFRLPGPIVVKQTPVITWNNPADLIYGTALSATQLNATANVAGIFTYAPVLGTVLNAANGQTLHADFTPTDIANYNNASANVTINVLQATTTISVNNLPSTATVGGTFTPTFTYTGDGTKSVTSSTLSNCTVSGGIVSFVGAGTCTVVAHATAGVNYAAANGSPQSFAITDAGVNEPLTRLIGLVQSMNLPKGRQTSLLAKLTSPPTCSQLQDFINEVSAQTGKSISQAQALQLKDAANSLSFLLGC